MQPVGYEDTVDFSVAIKGKKYLSTYRMSKVEGPCSRRRGRCAPATICAGGAWSLHGRSKRRARTCFSSCSNGGQTRRRWGTTRNRAGQSPNRLTTTHCCVTTRPSTSPHLALQHQSSPPSSPCPPYQALLLRSETVVRATYLLLLNRRCTPSPNRGKNSLHLCQGSEWRGGVDHEEGTDQEEARESSATQARHGCRCGAGVIKTRGSGEASEAWGDNTEGMRRGTTCLVRENWRAFLQNQRRDIFLGQREYST
jgi:hypothetical protein